MKKLDRLYVVQIVQESAVPYIDKDKQAQKSIVEVYKQYRK